MLPRIDFYLAFLSLSPSITCQIVSISIEHHFLHQVKRTKRLDAMIELNILSIIGEVIVGILGFTGFTDFVFYFLVMSITKGTQGGGKVFFLGALILGF